MVTFILLSTFCVLLLGLVLLVGIPPLKVSEKATRAESIEQLDRWLGRLYADGKFHGVVLLSEGDEVIFDKGYGFADIEKTGPLTPHASFNLASVSKQFTAVGIMLLKDQGKLSYSDRLQSIIPELDFYDGVTIQHLLHHTSGLPDYFAVVQKYMDDGEIVTAEKLIKRYSQRKPDPRFTPGNRFEYNNFGYVLLAEIIGRVSGQSYADFMQDHVFRPLGMKDTSVFNLLPEKAPSNRVFGFRKRYFIFGKKRVVDLNRFDGVVGDGGIYSSARDLCRWHRKLQTGGLITLETLSDAYRAGELNNGKKTGYGFGWFVSGDSEVEHAGGWQGFATYIHRDLEKDQLIVVLDNTANLLRVTSNGGRFNAIPVNLQKFMNRY